MLIATLTSNILYSFASLQVEITEGAKKPRISSILYSARAMIINEGSQDVTAHIIWLIDGENIEPNLNSTKTIKAGESIFSRSPLFQISAMRTDVKIFLS
ncbi:hypothetical protein RBH29_05670 [Herbivorax sp. ANBcel31]|uniref:hypothetical protein n=1 Tax=Herbivorax sp. ANBcel31 TaxID=3069754 RepID=UPI0027B24385|nr:hypothetical protein [Herbivorax sp. ANBcel31]MDQ2085926.1 hypothetical protein [Herbivorax sp. ANBcel31]